MLVAVFVFAKLLKDKDGGLSRQIHLREGMLPEFLVSRQGLAAMSLILPFTARLWFPAQLFQSSHFAVSPWREGQGQ